VSVAHAQPVAASTHGLDHPTSELAAQGRDVDLDHVGAWIEVELPDLSQQLVPREDLAGVPCEGGKQRGLACRQRDPSTGERRAVVRKVEVQRADLEESSALLEPAQTRLDPRRELGERERPAQAVVGASGKGIEP
jgi:hypothetical protein